MRETTSTTAVPAAQPAPDMLIEVRGVQTRVWVAGQEMDGVTRIHLLQELGELPHLTLDLIPAGGRER